MNKKEACEGQIYLKCKDRGQAEGGAEKAEGRR